MVVTVLGTGLMGYGMAARMAADGLDVRAWNRSADKARPLADQGVAVAEAPGEAVRGADVVITMLYDTDAVLEVMEQVAPQLSEGAVWLQMSTVGLDGTARLAQWADAHDVAMVDAPVLGTKKPAADGALVVLASGPSRLRDQLDPVLDSVASRTVWVGEELGKGSQLKLVCNAWVLTITAAVGQSVALAEGLGLDPQLFLDGIAGSASDCQYAHLKGAQMVSGDFTASFPIDGGLKDQGFITQAADSVGVGTGLIEEVGRLNRSAAELGHAADDLAAVYLAFAPAAS